MKNFDSNFNPSPFDDKNKDDLDEVLRECEIKNKELEDTLQQLLHFLVFHYQQQQQGKGNKLKEIMKQPYWPLVFICKIKDDLNIFAAMLERKNKDMTLGFAYDWLMEHKQILGSVEKDNFIKEFWDKNFEHKLI